ncbi:hypothetical protein J1614_008285 [Plenodomus biglobosus]|nr:hypothetical protein J1614_008285 [Plenodomus biglobosus]
MKDVSGDVHNGSIFRYKPLNRTRGSIRLLTVRPSLSTTGQIQCNIWHDTVDATYTCLSYVWGSDLNPKAILVNGSTLQVHENLWQFLDVARNKYASKPRTFWIDALCIDQTSFAERGHQVAQMGSIYSKAKDVLTWLGHSEAIERALTAGQAFTTPQYQGLDHVRDLWHLMDRQSKQDFQRDWRQVMSHPYWQRAWITQELLLARKLIFLVNHTEVACERLEGMRPYMYGSREWVKGAVDGRERWDAATHRFKTYLKALHEQNDISNQPLITLFHTLPDRLCKETHDKVYALLAIASDAASVIVDYQRPNNELIIQLLDLYKNATCSCYLVYLLDTLKGQLDSDAGNTLENYAFTMTMSATTTTGAIEPELSFTDRCSACHTRTPQQGVAEHIFCLGETCEMLRGVHFRLRKHKSPRGEYYTLKTDDANSEQNTISVEIQGRHEYNIDWNTALDDRSNGGPVPRQVFRIRLTAHALGRLLRPGIRSQVLVSRGLCQAVRKGQGSVRFGDIRTPGRVR